MIRYFVVLIALLAAAVTADAVPADATQDPRPGATVVTTGEGIVQSAPDRAWVTIVAESRAANAREAQRRNAEMMAPVQDKLRAAGIPADAVRTIAYDLQQEWDFVNNRRVARGYVARNTIEVRIDDVNRVGELLEIAVASGATSVGGVRFDVKDRAKLEREALRLAVSDARARAEAAATGAGRSLERIVRIEERGVSVPRPPVPLTSVRELAAADTPPISTGQIEVHAQVTLTAELK